mmetsp:Transcript_40675/g.95639  ORF Transcript_40675/g.95639 Transcript_40675/m.95639 type:complete len:245 (-) Transcript_40675:1274-2008(-)
MTLTTLPSSCGDASARAIALEVLGLMRLCIITLNTESATRSLTGLLCHSISTTPCVDLRTVTASITRIGSAFSSLLSATIFSTWRVFSALASTPSGASWGSVLGASPFLSETTAMESKSLLRWNTSTPHGWLNGMCWRWMRCDTCSPACAAMSSMLTMVSWKFLCSTTPSSCNPCRGRSAAMDPTTLATLLSWNVSVTASVFCGDQTPTPVCSYLETSCFLSDAIMLASPCTNTMCDGRSSSMN